MISPIDLIATLVMWIGLCFVSHCTELTRSQTVVDTKKSIRVEPDVLGSRKGTAITTRPSITNNNDSYQENNNNLIKKLAEKSNVAAENKILKVELAKLKFELALSENNNRKLEKALDELAASNKSAMEARILFLEEENMRLIDNQTKSKLIIEHKDRVLEAISLLSSADNIGDEMDNLCDNNLIGTDEKKTEVLRLLAERTEKTITQVTPDVGCEEPNMQPSNDLAICAAPIEVSAAESTDETLVDELCQSTLDTGTNLKPSTEEEVEYLLLSNLPPSVHGAEILNRLQPMIGQVKQYTMFVDDKGQYTGTMAVAFVHPSDVRRAYQTCDGMFFEGELQLWYQAEVAYYINGQRFYQKEEEPPAPVEVSQPTDETSADGLFQPTSNSMDDVRDDVISPAAASFVDTSRKVPDEYLIISNLPTSVDGAEIVNHIEIMIDCDVAHYNMFADDKGQYSGSMIVDFVHPSDARRAYKFYDGLLLEGNAIQVAYFINGQRSYQKEEELVPTATDGFCVADLIDASPTIDHAPIVAEVLAVHHQETLPGATTEEIHQSTHLDDPVVDKDLVEESLSCEINPILMTRKQKINKKTARRKKAKKNREAAASSSAE